MLLGPLRALDYFFSHGMLAVVLGAIWHLKSHWSISLVVGAVTRLIGLLGYFYITAWMLKEDLFSLLLNNVYSLLVRYTVDTIYTPNNTEMYRQHARSSRCFSWMDCSLLYVCSNRQPAFMVCCWETTRRHCFDVHAPLTGLAECLCAFISM